MNTKTTPKDFFLHLAATIALYVAAIALINLSFASINYSFPDVLAGYFTASSIVWPTSLLIILTPTLYVLEWLIRRDLAKNSEKKEVWIRRWRIYLTLFLTAATILGDLVYLLNTFLNGEITARFIYKVIVVLVVTAVIFAYYILERANDSARKVLWQRIFSWTGIVLVIASIIAGFTIVGSPAKQRALRFDQQRVSDLTNIQWQITSYWQQNSQLPNALTALNDSISGFIVPTDPADQSSYEYSKNFSKSDTSFELCAIFALPSQNNVGKGGYNNSGSVTVPYPATIGSTDNWNHTAGHVCFQRTIDPSRYPPIKK